MSSQVQRAVPGPEDIVTARLENGLTILTRENFSSPAVVVDGILRLGARLESRQQAGLASFHAAMLTRGTENYDFAGLFEQVEGNGASLEVGSGQHSLSFGTKSLAEDLPLMLRLLAEVLCKPTFPEEYVERVRGQKITGLMQRQQSTRLMASLTFNELAYPAEHPYSRSINGYLETVQAISRDDLVEFQRKLGPRDGIVVIVGAVKAEEAIDLVRQTFAGWHNPDQPVPGELPNVARLSEIKRKAVFVPGKSQADVVLGFPGPARSAPDYQAARMANSILGRFGMYGRLGDNIREKQGLAYYSYSSLGGGLGPGPWEVIAGVAPENVEKTVDSIRAELKAITSEPVTDEELADNKSYFKGSLALALETNEGVADSLMSMALYDLGLDYLERYPAVIDGLTKDSVLEAAQHYINAEAYALAVAGPEH